MAQLVSGSNLFQAVTPSLPLQPFRDDVLHWSLEQPRQVDELTRKQLTLHGVLQQKNRSGETGISKEKKGED